MLPKCIEELPIKSMQKIKSKEYIIRQTPHPDITVVDFPCLRKYELVQFEYNAQELMCNISIKWLVTYDLLAQASVPIIDCIIEHLIKQLDKVKI
jgi:hypothetical protein